MTKKSRENLVTNRRGSPNGDPLWYKDAVIYELHVRSFCDSNGDGIGDFPGLTSKLDYLQSLGVTALWILPFYPSPLKDDGYDTADYYNVHPHYGTLADFQIFLREAHARGLRVITEMVLNHTSDQHEWFTRSRRAKPGSPWRDFYVWSDTPDKYRDARIIFTDFETSNWSWDPVAKAYYWHRFYSHQPDLNFDNPFVVKAVLQAVDFWFEMGVDGLRLDAVPYLFEREGTNCENLPETYAFLETLHAHVASKFPDKMLLAEANQWPEDAVAYFGDGNRCHMAFHFPLMPRLFMASWMEDRFPVVDIIEQTPNIPDNCQWALFLRNHDELTLEMVSDEERDYMYRVYAKEPGSRINLGIRRRLAPLLGNDMRKIELMNFLLFSLPGTPVLYYGDEIGMGDNHYLGDRNGVRTPMQWNGDRNAGFSRANPQQLLLPVIIDPDYHYQAINVETQERNHASLLWWMRRLIALRKRFKAFSRGTLEFVPVNNPKVLAFIRQYEDERMLVVANLSRYAQVVELDMPQLAGFVPEEAASRNHFPVIGGKPYVMTLGSNNSYWFLLRKEEDVEPRRRRHDVPALESAGRWEDVLLGSGAEEFENTVLPVYLESCSWFGGHGRTIRQLLIAERIPLAVDSARVFLTIVNVRFADGTEEQYLLPIAFASGVAAAPLQDIPHAVIARLKINGTEGVLFDAAYDAGFRDKLLRLIVGRQSVRGEQGTVTAQSRKALKNKLAHLEPGQSQVLSSGLRNSSFLYQNTFYLKMYRRLDPGVNVELEMGTLLTEHRRFAATPALLGHLDYRRLGGEPVALGLLQVAIPNQGDAWSFTQNSADRYLEIVLTKRQEIAELPPLPASLLDMAEQVPPPLVRELVGDVYLEAARLIGRRTAELHLALADVDDDPAFAPEPFSLLYQRALYHAMRTQTKVVFERLRKAKNSFGDSLREDAQAVLELEPKILARFQRLTERKLSAMKIRIHGNYHLGQLLNTGNDFFITDFDGDPAKAPGERRLKRSPLRDVAGMARSFHYRPFSMLYTRKTLSPFDIRALEPYVDTWYKFVAGQFLRSYLDSVDDAPFIPRTRDELSLMLCAFLTDRVIQEIGHELERQSDWVIVPLRGIRHLIDGQ